VTLRLYEIPDGARATTVIGDQSWLTTRNGAVIRVTGPDGNWAVWHAGRTAAARAGVAELTLPN
jgi:alpha-D-xyloside xylohydrolase